MARARLADAQRDASGQDATIIVATRHGTVVAVEITTGKRLWQWVAEPRLGMLAHGGKAVYVVTVNPLPITRVEGQEGQASWMARAAQPQPVRQLHAFPTTVTALRTRDGAILWQREGWHPFGRGSVMLDGDVLVTDALAPGIGESAVTALNPETGETLWRRDTGTPWGPTERLLAARGGRVFVREAGDARNFCALEAHTGAMLWSRPEREPWHWFPEAGAVIADAETPGILTIRDARDGSDVAALLLNGSPLALTDDGIVYATGGTNLRPQLVALRTSDASELWRADMARPTHLIKVGDRLYCGRLTQPKHHAEVIALDASTGRQLWRWHSPAHLLGLLKLWGWRTPRVILAALAQARWSIRRARDSRDRGIVSREVIHGQWLRPTQLIASIQMAADHHAVYVGTSLGLFALRAHDGRLLWHALPTYDLSRFTPVVSPQSDGH